MEPYEKIELNFALTWASKIQCSVDEPSVDVISTFIKHSITDIKPTIAKFSKYTILHHFIKFEILGELDYFIDLFIKDHEPDSCLDYLLDFIKPYDSDYDELFKKYENYLEYEGDVEFIDESYCKILAELKERVMKLLPAMIEDVFYVLFQNRGFLLKFNIEVSKVIQTWKFDFDTSIMKSDGVLKRCRIFPVWLRDALMYRDIGRCQGCLTNLTGTEVRGEKIHFDHMVPLNMGGINDPTNVQILCATCNLKKSGDRIYTSIKYPRFW